MEGDGLTSMTASAVGSGEAAYSDCLREGVGRCRKNTRGSVEGAYGLWKGKRMTQKGRDTMSIAEYRTVISPET